MTELGFIPSSDKVGDQCSKIPNLDCFSWQWQRERAGNQKWLVQRLAYWSYSPSISGRSPRTGQSHLTSLSPFPAGVLPQVPFPLWRSRPLVIAAVSCDSQGRYHRTRGAQCITKANANQTGLLATNAESIIRLQGIYWMPTEGSATDTVPSHQPRISVFSFYLLL